MYTQHTHNSNLHTQCMRMPVFPHLHHSWIFIFSISQYGGFKKGFSFSTYIFLNTSEIEHHFRFFSHLYLFAYELPIAFFTHFPTTYFKSVCRNAINYGSLLAVNSLDENYTPNLLLAILLCLYVFLLYRLLLLCSQMNNWWFLGGSLPTHKLQIYFLIFHFSSFIVLFFISRILFHPDAPVLFLLFMFVYRTSGTQGFSWKEWKQISVASSSGVLWFKVSFALVSGNGIHLLTNL